MLLNQVTARTLAQGMKICLTSSRRRILEKCCECDMFKRDLARFSDEGHPLARIFSIVYDDYQHQKTQIQSLASFLDNKTLEVRFLHELGSVLQSSVDLEEVLSVALTAITAGKGFGMNRAFLLLVDKDREIPSRAIWPLDHATTKKPARSGTKFPTTTWTCKPLPRAFARTNFPRNGPSSTIFLSSSPYLLPMSIIFSSKP